MSGYYFCMNTNINRDFQICISVPLNNDLLQDKNGDFVNLFVSSKDVLIRMNTESKSKSYSKRMMLCPQHILNIFNITLVTEQYLNKIFYIINRVTKSENILIITKYKTKKCWSNVSDFPETRKNCKIFIKLEMVSWGWISILTCAKASHAWKSFSNVEKFVKCKEVSITWKKFSRRI